MNPDLHQAILGLLWEPWLCMLAVGFGIVLSFVKKLYDLEQTGTIISPYHYWRQHPYQLLMCFLSAYAFAGMSLFNGLLNVPFALLIGVGCDYAFDSLRTKAIGRMNDTNQQSGV